MARFFEKLILVFDMLISLKGIRIISWKNIERFFLYKGSSQHFSLLVVFQAFS